MKNIFQGNRLIRKCIADSLGYNFDESKKELNFEIHSARENIIISEVLLIIQITPKPVQSIE